MDFALVVFLWNPSNAVGNWVNSMFQKHSDRRGITASHNIDPDGSDQADFITPNDNVFLSVVGHSTRMNGEDHWTAITPAGNKQDLILTDT